MHQGTSLDIAANGHQQERHVSEVIHCPTKEP